jgi:hypothetical protein
VQIASAVVGVGAVLCLFEAAEHGGRLVYSYAGGVGLQNKDPADVGRLLLAGLYHQTQVDRKEGHSDQAAALVDLAARRFSGDVEVQLFAAESQLLDRKDPAAAIAALGAIKVPADTPRLRLRHAFLLADAQTASGQKDAARATLQSLRSEFPDNPRLKRKLDELGELTFALALLAATLLAAPNVIFVMSDDHAAHAISAYGSRVNQTPNIDRLAREGMLFRNTFVTNSICTPSRATILTGTYSHKNGVPVFNRFDSSQTTVATLDARRRVLHGDGRQVAPRQRPGRLRLLGDPARPGGLRRPDPLHRHRREDLPRLRHRRDHRPRHRLHPQPPEGPAVLPDVPPQGAAPVVDARREAPADVREPRDPGAAHAPRRLRDAHRRAPREPAARRRRPHAPRPEARAPGGARGQ